MAARCALPLLLLALVACVPHARADDSDAPWFCHSLDCPRFKLVKNHTDLGIEHRQVQMRWDA